MSDTTYAMLRAHPFLTGMSDRQVDRLATWAESAIFHTGTRIFDENGHADRFWLIIEGLVRLETTIPGRGAVTVEPLGPGTVLGWSWLFPPYRWHFSAAAAELTYSIVLDGPGVRELCASDPALGYELTTRFMNVVVDRLQQTRLRLIDAYGRTPA